jgi:2-(3-amino-3-carboxypropyl)histidine synthase
MKTIFIPAEINSEIDSSKIFKISKKLPKNIAIAYSIQYKKIAFKIKEILSKNHKIVSLTQVLGCSNAKFIKNARAILIITDGKFHAISLASESKLPVYIFCNNKLEKVSLGDIKNVKKKKKASYLKYLNADKIGILVSTKPGQQNLKRALELKKHVKSKSSYLFIANNLNKSEFENFLDIGSWVNTACPRLDFDTSIVDMGEITN